jgi:hypothetical protein
LCFKEHAHEHTGSAEAFRLSPRNGFTAYFALSPATGFLATLRPEKLASQGLDANVGASGPHDSPYASVPFVRAQKNARRRCRGHRIPPTSVTMANAPVPEQDDGDKAVIWVKSQANF